MKNRRKQTEYLIKNPSPGRTVEYISDNIKFGGKQ